MVAGAGVGGDERMESDGGRGRGRWRRVRGV